MLAQITQIANKTLEFTDQGSTHLRRGPSPAGEYVQKNLAIIIDNGTTKAAANT